MNRNALDEIVPILGHQAKMNHVRKMGSVVVSWTRVFDLDACILFLIFKFSSIDEFPNPALRVPPGGNQVDGLPPAFSMKEKEAQVPRTPPSQTM